MEIYTLRGICFLTMVFSISILSCKQSGHTNGNSVEIPGTNPVTDHTALDSAWGLAHDSLHLESFYHEFELITEELKKIRTTMMIGNFFTSGKYLIIKRESPMHFGLDGPAHFINIYRYSVWRDTFEPVISNAEDLENYVSDTIQDINGDGRKDFIANYRTTLNGIKSRYTMVNVATSDSTFSSSGFSGLFFANPTFSIDEKIIRGVLHGKSGRTELYKFRWNSNLGIDTIEYIYHGYIHSQELQGQFIKSRFMPHDRRNKQEENVLLKSLPDEYKNLPELDWFLGNNDGVEKN